MTKQEFYLVVAMAVVTFLIRYPLLAFSSRIKLPAKLIEALSVSSSCYSDCNCCSCGIDAIGR